MNLKDLKREWEEIASQDAYWAVLSQRNRKFGKWDIQQFFRTGEQQIEIVIKSANRLGYPLQRQIALDFGCGPGRLTRALSKHFRQSIGIDISEKMIDYARSLNTDLSNCSFLVNNQDNLQLFTDNHFDLVYSNLVLQHLPSKATIYSYISEFVRIIKPNGLLVFQLPNSLPFEVWIQPRRILYRILRLGGFSERFLYWKLGLHPIRMKAIPKRDVVFFLSSIGAKLIEVQTHNDPEFKFESSTYFSTK